MLSTSSPAELLRLSTLRDVLRSPGPCITILLPPYRPGEPAGSPATVLKTSIREAARQFAEREVSKAARTDLLQPIESLAEDPTFAAGSHWGRAIFRSPSVFRQFDLTQASQPFLNVAGCFSIRQLTAELARPRVFYILVLSKTRVALLRCAGFHAEIAKLPAGVPDTLTEALELEPPDHDLENRSAAGISTGNMHGVRFGTGSGRETARVHLADFYKLVDRGLQEVLRESEIPLILAGVDEDATVFRAVSNYRHLSKKGIGGSAYGSFRQEEVLEQAYSILRNDDLEREASSLRIARERVTATRFSTDPDTILHAAFEGRVSQLYVNQSAEKIDVFERRSYQNWGKEDLLNLAAVQTIIHYGKASVLPAELMPEASTIVGIMRF